MNKLILIALLLAVKVTFADFPRLKYGKISKEDMAMTVYPQDSSAHAVILGDYGRSYFAYDGQQGWRIRFERHVRVKILDQEGVGYANFEVPLHKNGSTSEKILSIRGTTFNLEDGKIVKSKLSRDSRFTEEVSKYYSKEKISMPDVKAGSVIDIKYNVESEFIWELREWQFQYDIPVQYSMYEVEIPEYFNYNRRAKGYHPMAINETSSHETTLSFSVSEMAISGQAGPSRKYTQTFLSNCNVFGMKDIPAFKEEPYMTARSNFISEIAFELASTKMPGRGIKTYTQSWEAINHELLSDDDFGRQLSASKEMKEEITNITNGLTDKAAIAATILAIIQNRMNWNERFGVTTDKGIRKAYKEQRGNVAEINLLLVTFLREAGLNAYPVVLSTRNHGMVHPSHPTISQFNYIIASVEIDGEFHLMDGTDPLCPMGILPVRCLNHEGRIIDNSRGDWISLRSNYRWDNTSMLTIDLDKDGEINGTLTERLKGYAAISRRSKLLKAGEDNYLEDFVEDHPGIEVDEFIVEQKDSIYKPLKSKFKIDLTNSAEKAGDKIYLNPIIFNRIKKNPFKLEERQFPVDYAYKHNETFILNLNIPEGYVVDELPKSQLITLPNKSGEMKYIIRSLGNTITVQQILKINQVIFNSTDYEVLKQFYDEIVASQSQQIVLKKS